MHHVDGSVDRVDPLELVGHEVVDGQLPGHVFLH